MRDQSWWCRRSRLQQFKSVAETIFEFHCKYCILKRKLSVATSNQRDKCNVSKASGPLYSMWANSKHYQTQIEVSQCEIIYKFCVIMENHARLCAGKVNRGECTYMQVGYLKLLHGVCQKYSKKEQYTESYIFVTLLDSSCQLYFERVKLKEISY